MVFFKVERGRATISTGLFDGRGNLFGPDQAFTDQPSQDQAFPDQGSLEQGLFLGVQRDHPLVETLIESPVPHRAYFLLTYLSNQLAPVSKTSGPFQSVF